MELGRGCQTRYKLQDLYQEHRYVGVLHFQKVLLYKEDPAQEITFNNTSWHGCAMSLLYGVAGE